MSWDEHSRRRAAIDAVLEFAAGNPDHGLGYEHLPVVQALFKDRRELVLALQYQWSLALWARIELLSLDPRNARRRAPRLDAGQLARVAWAETALRHPVLRRLLDTHREELGPTIVQDEQLLISAGLGHCAEGKVYRSPSRVA
jgi:hypothetical protein